jgi:UDP-N-acetyl-alpha-D-muramoyl-L-alanyl-L-glutamate epimerase
MTFRYLDYTTDPETGVLACHYDLNGNTFTEQVTLPPGPRWNTSAAQAAARMVFLLAGVSYYKTAAPDVVDLGDHPLTVAEREFLRSFYVNGLAEFAHRNNLTLNPRIVANTPSTVAATASTETATASAAIAQSTPLERHDCAIDAAPGFVGAAAPGPAASAEPATANATITATTSTTGHFRAATGYRALVPFGGGIDSIVTVEQVRRRADDVALFVVSRPGDRYEAIERPAAVSGLPVIRAERAIDPQLFDPGNNFLNGHVPVTGIISAIAVLAAVLDGRDTVVMSNEWSASIPTLFVDGRAVNHQWSKSAEFENGFREIVKEEANVRYFSWLRDRTELWVGREFAELTQYHGTFRSCNKAFYADPARRLDYWCGECDKCCFIDLILAPFVPANDLAQIFKPATEPLTNEALKPKFEALLGKGAKPFECVGEVNECRAALLLAAARTDRRDDHLLHNLADETDTLTQAEVEAMLEPVVP